MDYSKKAPYTEPVCDFFGKKIEVGNVVAYAVRQGNSAKLQSGVVEFIESVKNWMSKEEEPVMWIMFEGNSKPARCCYPTKAIVMGAQFE